MTFGEKLASLPKRIGDDTLLMGVVEEGGKDYYFCGYPEPRYVRQDKNGHCYCHYNVYHEFLYYADSMERAVELLYDLLVKKGKIKED